MKNEFKRSATFLILVALLSACAVPAKKTQVKEEPPKTATDLKSEYTTETDPEKKFYLLTDYVNQYASKDIPVEEKKEIKAAAESLLKMAPKFKGTWNYGNAIHQGNLVIGRVQLADDKLKSAESYLLAASMTPGSPQLNSFGPNMTLAKELLEKQRTSTVMKYINNCLKFWKGTDAVDRANTWKKKIEAKEVPDFGANLVY